MWEGREKPKSILDEKYPHVPLYNTEKPKGEVNPNVGAPKQLRFEKVKR